MIKLLSLQMFMQPCGEPGLDSGRRHTLAGISIIARLHKFANLAVVFADEGRNGKNRCSRCLTTFLKQPYHSGTGVPTSRRGQGGWL